MSPRPPPRTTLVDYETHDHARESDHHPPNHQTNQNWHHLSQGEIGVENIGRSVGHVEFG